MIEQKFTLSIIRSLCIFTVLYFILNGVITLFRWFPGYDFHLLLAPSVESVGIMIILGLSLLFGHRIQTGILALLSGLTVIYVVFGFGEALNQYAFERHFVPWTDIAFISPLVDMVFRVNTGGNRFVLIAAALLIFLLLTALFYFFLNVFARQLQKSYPYSLLLGVYLIPALFLFGAPQNLTSLMIAQLEPPTPVVIPDEGELVKQAANPDRLSEEQERAHHFPRLKDRDVYLFIVESYGHTLFSRKEHFELIEPAFDEAQRSLTREGYTMASHFLSSPITGGRSWLADATLLTGVWVDSQPTYDKVITTDITNIIHVFNDAGYRTIMSAPGTTAASNDWKRFYPFDEYYFAEDFNYQGPPFCFGEMPDQYQLNKLRLGPLNRPAEKDTDSVPLFLMAILVSSHTPFNFVPAYIPNWDSITDGSEYYALDNLRFHNNWISGGEYPEGYTASVGYVLKTLTAFFTNYIEDTSLIIVIGDHQPRFPVREKESTKSVIAHILSRDQTLIAPFHDYGFTPGLKPDQLPPHPKLDRFAPMLLDISRSVYGFEKELY
jgi:hypothetical protein